MNDGSGRAGKSVAIIGGGIAGLCAGCYAQMNGYRSRIYEMHDLPGGLMTAWERKGYTIDYCIHWLVGSSPKAEHAQAVAGGRACCATDRSSTWTCGCEYEGADGQRGDVLARPRPPRGGPLPSCRPATPSLIERLLEGRAAAGTPPTCPSDLPPRELMRTARHAARRPGMVPWMLPARRWGKLTDRATSRTGSSPPLLRDAIRLAHARRPSARWRSS